MSLFNSKDLISVGDILRNIALIVLIFYVYQGNILFFILFLFLYTFSSAFIANYAFTHKLKYRAYSEWFGGIVTLCLFIYYLH
jgi:hypothetical protein